MKTLDSRTFMQAGAQAPTSDTARAQPVRKRRITALQAGLPLTDLSLPKERRAEMSYEQAKESIEERKGMQAKNYLKVEEVPHVGVRVRGSVTVDAGCPTIFDEVRIGVDPDVVMVVQLDKQIDEDIVNAVKGYGMGALDVTFRVTKYDPVYGDAEYVITTNDSIACTEDKKTQVALTLLRAAEMVEEMLSAKKEERMSKNPSNVVNLSDYKEQAQKDGKVPEASSDAQSLACLKG